MSIKINNQCYSEHHIEQLMIAIQQLPKVGTKRQDAQTVNTEQSLIHLQREAAFINRSQDPHLRFIGTKNLNSCLQVFFKNADNSECLGLHVDGDPHYDLQSKLALFSSQQLSMDIIGGTPNNPLSKTILKSFLKTLINESDRLGIDITIESQHLLNTNEFKDNDRYEFIFNKILENAECACRYFFGESLDYSQFNEQSIDDLRTKNPNSFNQFTLVIGSILGQINEAKHIENDSNFQFYVTMAQQTGLLPKQNESTENKNNQKTAFYEHVKNLFSTQSFALLYKTYNGNSIYPKARLRDFVLDLDNNTVCQISPQHNHTLSNSEHMRHVAMMSPADNHKHYMMVYNSNEQQLRLRQPSKTLISKLDQYKQSGDRSPLCRHLGIDTTDAYNINMIGRYLNLGGDVPLNSLTNPESQKMHPVMASALHFFAHSQASKQQATNQEPKESLHLSV